jgi:hypothetical protein
VHKINTPGGSNTWSTLEGVPHITDCFQLTFTLIKRATTANPLSLSTQRAQYEQCNSTLLETEKK